MFLLLSPRGDSLGQSLQYVTRTLLGKGCQVRKAARVELRQRLVRGQQGHIVVLSQPPLPIGTFSRIGRCNPVVNRSRGNTDDVGRFGLLSDGDQELRAVALLRLSEALDLIDRRLVQVHVLAMGGHVAWLLAYDLGAGVLRDADAMRI